MSVEALRVTAISKVFGGSENEVKTEVESPGLRNFKNATEVQILARRIRMIRETSFIHQTEFTNLALDAHRLTYEEDGCSESSGNIMVNKSPLNRQSLLKKKKF